MSKEFLLTQDLNGTLHIEFNMHCLPYLSIGSLPNDSAKLIFMVNLFNLPKHLKLAVVETFLQVVLFAVPELRGNGRICCSFEVSDIRIGVFFSRAQFSLTPLFLSDCSLAPT